ncbi:hypothetical protein BO79DRAFT_271166 [Aspergillus costaricaensis CBS 115574]|uniref:Uncharacterized protein n=1 Tax=Aspergillus costaricaensis CBS 115574 TaxID=1448317 RepID=A0ACD1I841_9EURO|nr:hypothetical protein BO79DRAFT_271166 [Aspergillus costaricaensis CBS 115574]RAK86394.1 hypothetical protein BO79DRAFT_271166 [Aspergillus costaricaensis CBS 115574]
MPAASPNVSPRAPWRDILDVHLHQTPGYEFTIATVGRNEKGQAVPRVRVCGFRGFFPDLDLHPSGKADLDEQVANGSNLPSVESDMFTFTTDSRMEKLKELQSSNQEIEALFWLKEASSQWGIQGKAWVLGNPCGEMDAAEKESRSAIEKQLQPTDHQGVGDTPFDWDYAVTKYFANHSPLMRGSFRSRSPGKPKHSLPDDCPGAKGHLVTDLYDPEARENFRVVAIIPEIVELLDLSDSRKLQRWKWTKDHSPHSQWIQTELWP